MVSGLWSQIKRRKKQYLHRKKYHLCTICGRELDDPHYATCTHCRNREKRRWRKKKLAKG